MSVGVDTDSVIPGIEKRGGTYTFRANVPGSNGKQVRRGGFPTQDAAYRARIRFLGGQVDDPATTTVAGWFAEFLYAKEGEVRETTIEGYKYHLGLIMPLIGDLPLAELNEMHLRSAYRSFSATHATSTIKTIHLRVRTALRQAVRERRIGFCVADGLIPPRGKQTRARRTWTFAQLVHFSTSVANERDAALWAMWVTTGLRRGEICGLVWSDVDLEGASALICRQRTKTAGGRIIEGEVKTDSGNRSVILSPKVVSILRAWRVRQPQLVSHAEQWERVMYVFTSARGHPYHPDSFNERLKVLASRYGLPTLTPHELRHTFASRALDNKMEIKVLSTLLGHSRIQTTMDLYMHVSAETARQESEDLAARMLG